MSHHSEENSFESSDSEAAPALSDVAATVAAVRGDSAWGRASFTEAEIKKAFEVAAEGERTREELANAEAKSPNKSGKSKGSSKSQTKKKDDKSSKKKDKKDKSKDKSKRDDDDDLHNESREAGDWDELIRAVASYDELVEPQQFELNDDQLKCDTFDEWINLTEAQQAVPMEASAQFDPFAQRSVNIDESRVLSVPAKPLTDLGPEIMDRIVKQLEFSDLDSVSRVCKVWHKSYGQGQPWRELYHLYDARIPLSEGDKHLWEELGTDFSTATNNETPGNVREASLNALIAAVTPQAGLPDSMDVNTFVTTYQTFATTELVVKKLLQRYQVPEKTFPNPEEAKQYMVNVVRPIQLRVVKIMKQLIETNYKEILMDEVMLNTIRSFIRGVIDQTALSKQLQSALLAVNKKEAEAAAAAAASGQMDPSKKRVGTLKDIFDLSPEEVAKQLTLVEYETYVGMQPAEFFGQAWAKEKTHHRAPHIRKMIDRFNLITRWITTEIVSEEKIRNRIKRLVKFIKVAEHLKEMHNYHTLMAVLAGLNEGPVYRLKFTLAEIPQKFKDTLKSLQDLMSADGSYAAYRAELAAAVPPCIPYIGIYLRDLTYFEEGGSSAGEGLINFKKKKNVYSVIQIIQKYQKTPYEIKKNDRAYNFLLSPPMLDNEALFRMSLQIEPRNAKRNEIQ